MVAVTAAVTEKCYYCRDKEHLYRSTPSLGPLKASENLDSRIKTHRNQHGQRIEDRKMSIGTASLISDPIISAYSHIVIDLWLFYSLCAWSEPLTYCSCLLYTSDAADES